MSKAQSPTRRALGIVRRLLGGEELTVSDVATDSFSEDAARRHLGLIEEELPGVVGEGSWRRRWRYENANELAVERRTAAALVLARGALSALSGSELHLRLSRFVDSDLRMALHDVDLERLDRMFFAKSKSVNALGPSAEHADRIVPAVLDCRRIQAYYETFNGKLVSLTMEPYSLIVADEGLYLYGLCVYADDEDWCDERRTLNLEGIRSVQVLQDRFVYPPRDTYNPHQDLKDSFGVFLVEGEEPSDITLRFHPRWATVLRRHRWHPSQTAPAPTPLDGELWQEIRLRVHVRRDFVRWVRAFGREVRVVGPDELKVRVRDGWDAWPSRQERLPFGKD